MYTLIKSFPIGSLTNYHYKEIDVSTTPLNYLYTLYDDVVISVSNSFTGDVVYLSLLSIYEDYYSSSKTIQVALDELATKPLPFFTKFNPFARHVTYRDAVQAGYRITPCKIGVDPTNPLPDGSKTDAYLTRPSYDTDVFSINDYALVTVNGYLHNTATDNRYMYVIDAGTSLLKSNRNYIGITSFRDIGKLTKIPITESMLYKQDPSFPYYKKTYIRTGVDLTGKSILLSLGGYLLYPDQSSFIITGDGSIGLSMEMMPILERVLESIPVINLDTILDDPTVYNDNVLNVPNFTLDVNIVKYLTMSQSFIIIVDTNELLVNKIVVGNTNYPHVFISHTEPIYPLCVGYGKLVEYWKVEEDGQWALHVDNPIVNNYVMTYTAPTLLKVISDASLPRDKIRQFKAHYLEIYTN